MLVPSLFDFTQQGDWFERYMRFDVASFARLLQTRDEGYWRRLGEQRALALFHEAARRVPAYKDFLKKHQVRHERIITISCCFRGRCWR